MVYLVVTGTGRLPSVLGYSQVDFGVFHPVGIACCTDDEICHCLTAACYISPYVCVSVMVTNTTASWIGGRLQLIQHRLHASLCVYACVVSHCINFSLLLIQK